MMLMMMIVMLQS